jgi:hypothetical protein
MKNSNEFGIGRRIDLTIDGKNVVAEIYTKQNKEHVAIAPLCDAIGISANMQRKRIKADPKFTGYDNISRGRDGKNRTFICLPVEEVGLWLCGINTKRVKKDVAPILLAFQKHCHIELHAAITGKAGIVRVEALEKQMADMVQIMKSQAETIADLRNDLYQITSRLAPIAKTEQILASIGGKLMGRSKQTKILRDKESMN